MTSRAHVGNAQTRLPVALALPAGSDLEEMAYSLWALAHGMAMLQQTHLRHFQADFSAVDRRVLEAFVQGWAQV